MKIIIEFFNSAVGLFNILLVILILILLFFMFDLLFKFFLKKMMEVFNEKNFIARFNRCHWRFGRSNR